MVYSRTTPRQRAWAQDAGRWLALGAVVAPILFMLGAFLLAPTHPGYSIVRQQVSALAVGPHGELMRSLFLLYGVLVTVGTMAVFVGLRDELGTISRWTCAALLSLSPLGVLWCGVFTMDQWTLHLIGVQVAFTPIVVTLPIAGLLLRRAPNWRRFGTLMILGGPLTLGLIIGLVTSIPQSQMLTGGGTFGLWQRALGGEVFTWFVALGWLYFRHSRRAAAGSPK